MKTVERRLDIGNVVIVDPFGRMEMDSAKIVERNDMNREKVIKNMWRNIPKNGITLL